MVLLATLIMMNLTPVKGNVNVNSMDNNWNDDSNSKDRFNIKQNRRINTNTDSNDTNNKNIINDISTNKNHNLNDNR